MKQKPQTPPTKPLGVATPKHAESNDTRKGLEALKDKTAGIFMFNEKKYEKKEPEDYEVHPKEFNHANGFLLEWNEDEDGWNIYEEVEDG